MWSPTCIFAFLWPDVQSCASKKNFRKEEEIQPKPSDLHKQKRIKKMKFSIFFAGSIFQRPTDQHDLGIEAHAVHGAPLIHT